MSRPVVRGTLRNHFQADGIPKRAYANSEDATEALGTMLNNPSTRQFRRRRLSVYECRFCAKWHIGHGKPRSQR